MGTTTNWIIIGVFILITILIILSRFKAFDFLKGKIHMAKSYVGSTIKSGKDEKKSGEKKKKNTNIIVGFAIIAIAFFLIRVGYTMITRGENQVKKATTERIPDDGLPDNVIKRKHELEVTWRIVKPLKPGEGVNPDPWEQ